MLPLARSPRALTPARSASYRPGASISNAPLCTASHAEGPEYFSSRLHRVGIMASSRRTRALLVTPSNKASALFFFCLLSFSPRFSSRFPLRRPFSHRRGTSALVRAMPGARTWGSRHSTSVEVVLAAVRSSRRVGKDAEGRTRWVSDSSGTLLFYALIRDSLSPSLSAHEEKREFLRSASVHQTYLSGRATSLCRPLKEGVARSVTGSSCMPNRFHERALELSFTGATR